MSRLHPLGPMVVMLLFLLGVLPRLAAAQEQSHAGHAQPTEQETKTLPNLSERRDWPDAVADSATHTFLLFDNAELQRASGPNALRWDLFGWHGGDVNRFWFKSEGRATHSLTEQGSEYEAQALYGRLIAPYFDLQAGVRVDQRLRADAKPLRVYAVVGLQGLAPYRFDVEPTLFISNKGQVSWRLTATYDILLTQRLILQPRFEANAAAQDDEEIGIGAGLNDAEIGVRMRFETRRELAPYIGVSWKESFGATHRLTVKEGGDPAHVVIVAGARMWF